MFDFRQSRPNVFNSHVRGSRFLPVLLMSAFPFLRVVCVKAVPVGVKWNLMAVRLAVPK
jgi:hypothetical protein